MNIHSPRRLALDQEAALRARLLRVEGEVARLSEDRHRLEQELVTINTRRSKLKAEAEAVSVAIQIAHEMSLEEVR